MKKYEVIIHIDKGILEDTLDALDEMEGVELAGMNRIVSSEILAMPKKKKQAIKRAIKKRKKKRPVLRVKGEMESMVMEAIENKLPEVFDIHDLRKEVDALDPEAVSRALSRLSMKGNVRKVDRGRYRLHKSLALAQVS